MAKKHCTVSRPLPQFNETQAAHFWSCVKTAEADECWEWTKCLSNGYGLIRFKGHDYKAHRVSYTLSVGAIPAGLCVCHRCDNKKCCNPSHLFVGTYADNVHDMCSKGRQRSAPPERRWFRLFPERVPHGINHYNAKLDPEIVRQMRAMRESGAYFHQIAAKFGVNKITAHDVVHRRTWRHVS